MDLDTEILNNNSFRNLHPESPCQDISEGFLLLELVFRLQEGFRRGLVDQICFMKRIVLDTGTGTTISARDFDSQALEARFHNLVFSAMATLVIAVDVALKRQFGDRNPGKTDSLNSLRNFFYMLRCACAHDVMKPLWEIKGKYKTVYNVIVPKEIMQKITQNRFHSDKMLQYDFNLLNNQLVSIGSFHGIDGLIACRLYALNLCESSVGTSKLGK